MDMTLVNDVGKAIWSTLDDNWETYVNVSIGIVLFSIAAYVSYSLVSACVAYVRYRWQDVIPAMKLARSWLEEKRMRERNRAEEVKVMASDAITEALDELLLEGKLSRKERNRLWTRLGRAMELPDLLVHRIRHPKAIIAAINGRHIDKTPVPLPDLNYSPTEKLKRLMRKTA